jgi:hypothetical protein
MHKSLEFTEDEGNAVVIEHQGSQVLSCPLKTYFRCYIQETQEAFSTTEDEGILWHKEHHGSPVLSCPLKTYFRCYIQETRGEYST